MMKLITSALLEKLEVKEECKIIRANILNKRLNKILNEDDYKLASDILNDTSEEYFYLGFKSCLHLMLEAMNN